MAKRLTDYEIDSRTKEKSLGRLKFLGYSDVNFRGKDNKGRFQHDCGTIFDRLVGNVLYAGAVSCPDCDSENFPRTEYILTTKLKDKGYQFVTGLYGDRDFCTVRHLDCGCLAVHTVGALLSAKSPKCPEHTEGYRSNIPIETIQSELMSFEFGSFTLVGLFVNKAKPFTVECTKCGSTKKVKNFGILESRGGKCWECFGSVKSIKEEFVAICLEDLGVSFEREVKLGNFRYDFLIKGTNVLIEYDGLQHKTSKWLGSEIKLSDKEKQNYAVSCGYRLERINTDDSIIKRLIQIVESSTTIPKGSTPK